MSRQSPIRRMAQDCTFVIPYYQDSMDRRDNLSCILRYITDNFHTHIHISAIAPRPDGVWHRTQALNKGILAANTPIVILYDTDVVFPIDQLVQAIYRVRLDNVDACYPYGGDFVDIKRHYITTGQIDEHQSLTKESVGGAVVLNKNRYLYAGLENENIVGWGPEDHERYARMKALGFVIERIDGKCYHIQHERGINSSNQNPLTAHNLRVLEKVKSMDRKEAEGYASHLKNLNSPTTTLHS